MANLLGFGFLFREQLGRGQQDQNSRRDHHTYPNEDADQMLWGCMGQWYSSGWYDDGALGYIDWINTQLSEQRWLQQIAQAPLFATSYASVRHGCTAGAWCIRRDEIAVQARLAAKMGLNDSANHNRRYSA